MSSDADQHQYPFGFIPHHRSDGTGHSGEYQYDELCRIESIGWRRDTFIQPWPYLQLDYDCVRECVHISARSYIQHYGYAQSDQRRYGDLHTGIGELQRHKQLHPDGKRRLDLHGLER